MIHRIQNLTDSSSEIFELPEKPAPKDYRNVIVKKPWGYEYLVFENNHVAIWILHIVRKRKTSMHCHPNKKTGLILLSGKATFHHLAGDVELNPMDGVVIEKGAFHSTEAFSDLPIEPVSENGIWVMEIETPPLKTDLVRMNDAYGRAGMSYEGRDKMVFEPKEILDFFDAGENGGVKKSLHDCTFTVRKGDFTNGQEPQDPEAFVSVIGGDFKNPNSQKGRLKIGDLTTLKDFREETKDEDLSDHLILTIEKSKTLIKLSDYIFSFIADLGVKDVFAVCGGGAMHLVDSVGKSERLNYVATHHEQAAAMAAEGYARISGKPGVALVTSGPGGTNTITGVCGAWIDSIPTIFISGQVTSDTLIGDTRLRQFGIQESNIVELVRPVTKYAVTVTDPKTIRYHLEKAAYLAVTGRPGPVWLDIPLDVQGKIIDIKDLEPFRPSEIKVEKRKHSLKKQVTRCIEMLTGAKRPVIISGYGIRLAQAEREYACLVDRLGVPIVSSWTSSDLIPSDHKFYIGRSGIMGDRGSNFAVQNSDLLLIIGSRMSIPQIGYNYSTYAREAKKIMVDISEKELNKPSLKVDLPINVDVKAFINELYSQLDKSNVSIEIDDWLQRCLEWKKKYPVALPEYRKNKKGVNSFYFVDLLSEKLGNDAVVVTDMGTSFTCTMQTFRTKAGQRLFTSSGHASMGFGLPGAIGACFSNNRKKTICISGDGALQMNIQELQTIVHYELPIILFILNNAGYLTIKLMQQNHFGNYVGSEPGSGLSCPDIIKVGKAYGIKTERVSNQKRLNERIDAILDQKGPYICEIMMPEDQPLIPRVSSMKKANGTIVAKPLEDLYPFLDRDEFNENMLIDPVEVLK